MKHLLALLLASVATLALALADGNTITADTDLDSEIGSRVLRMSGARMADGTVGLRVKPIGTSMVQVASGAISALSGTTSVSVANTPSVTLSGTGTVYAIAIGNTGSGHTNAALTANTLAALGNHPCWQASIFNAATNLADGSAGPGTLYVFQDGFSYPIRTQGEHVFAGITNSSILSVSNLEACTIPYRFEPAR